jgi:hypothetical protein
MYSTFPPNMDTMTRCWVQRLGRGTKMVIVADQAGHDGMTTEKILAALDKPRQLYSILMVVNPSGSLEELQQKLLKMRDEGLVKFDIHKGRWYLPN